MIRAVLFDLDDTLLDTRVLMAARRARLWRECGRRFRETVCFPGVADVLSALREGGIKLGIVTKAPDAVYAVPVLRHHGLTVDTVVGYHQVGGLVKPHPRGAQLALERFGLLPAEAVGVGDDMPDCGCFTNAGLAGVYGAGWSPTLDRGAPWSAVLESPLELLTRCKPE